MHTYFFRLLFLSFLFVACTVKLPTANPTEVRKLAQMLAHLHGQTEMQEAQALSQDILNETKRLGEAFEMTSPPQYHNFLVNIGMKEKGLCYQWADALYFHFIQSTQYPSFRFHLVGANIGEYWREHNSLVVVAKGMAVEDGLIIDPWRNAGKLYFSKLKKDSKYRWQHRPPRCCQNGK